MEVAKHDIGTPTANKLNNAGVDVATEQGHGATGSTRASRNVGCIETESRAQDSSGGPDRFGDQLGGDGTPCIGRGTPHNAQWCIVRGTVDAKVADAVDNAYHWTGIEMA
jgi:hypothetical protein